MILTVIELALTAVAKEGRERFSLTWLRQQSEECLVTHVVLDAQHVWQSVSKPEKQKSELAPV